MFSDEHGDWPAGSYLLNPEGFRHAPYSRDGCLLFVKLRQYPGTDRRHVAADAETMSWEPVGGRRERKLLYAQPGYQDTTRLERWSADSALGELVYARGAELFVLDGSFEDEHGQYDAHTWIRLPAQFTHRPTTQERCALYVKEGGFAYLRSASAS